MASTSTDVVRDDDPNKTEVAAPESARKEDFSFNSAVWALGVGYLTNSMNQTVLFPFCALMVRSFHVTNDEASLGYYAGNLASAFFLGNLFTSSFWGMWSDKYGRKPVILLGLLSNAIGLLLFGFSTSLTMALIVRFVHGLLSVIMGIGWATVAELYEEKRQAEGYSMLGMTYGIGFVLGPSLGGYLCLPTEKYPSLFGGWKLFEDFPYLLPCAVLSFFSFISFFSTLMFLPETLGRADHAARRQDSVVVSEDVDSSGSGEEVARSAALSDRFTDSKMFNFSGSFSDAALGGALVAAEMRKPLLAPDDDDDDVEDGKKREECCGFCAPFLAKLLCAEEELVHCLLVKDTVISTLVYSLFCMISTAFIEFFSLWVITDWSYGGLSLGSDYCATALAFNGIIRIPIQAYIWVPLVNKIGIRLSFQLTQLMGLLAALYPYARSFGRQSVMMSVAIYSIQASQGFAFCAVNGGMNLISNSIDNPRYIGAIVGMVQTVSTFLRAIAPTIGTTMFAWSISGVDPGNESLWSINSSFCFLMFAVCCLLGFFLSLLLSKDIDRSKLAVQYAREE